MDRVTQWIADNPVISTWITFISLFGVIITVVALLIQISDKKRRAVFYTMTSNVLLDNEISQIEGIKVLFNEEIVDTIVISNLKIWNGGNQILERTDFYPEKELKVVVPKDCRMLAATVVDETEETCKVNIELQDDKTNEAIITFYCLEPKQGATFNIYHTNVDEKKTVLGGKIKDGKIVNKSIEIVTEDGEMCISTGKYKIYFDRWFFKSGAPVIRLFPGIMGISIVRKKNRK